MFCFVFFYNFHPTIHLISPIKPGKSNVMDALSFALGERAATLRVKHLRDLLHGAHIGRPVSDTARVALRYRDDKEQETIFCRTIRGDSSEYHINGAHVNLSKYMVELERIGIVTKAQNCLVFQGAVESIALKDPKERTKMFELISQSKEYAAEYEQKKEALLKAKEDTQFHFNNKKSATVEKKHVTQEKMEAQRYQALVDELHENCLQLSLAELYNNERGIKAQTINLREKQQAVAVKNNKVVNSEQMVKTHKKKHGRLTREQQQIEKEICAQEHSLSQSRSQFIKAKVNMSHHLKKAEEIRDTLKKSQKLLNSKKQELSEGQQELAELKRTWNNYEKEVQQQISSRGEDIELQEDQVRQCFSSLLEYHQQEESLNAELQRGRQRTEEVNQELGQVLEELGNAHLYTQDSSRKLQRKELLEKLRRFYPESVYGRLFDLCSPIHKKYQLAVTKVFGHYMNAIVVTMEKVARDCICFIKEERLEPETFLPIDYLDVCPLNERLRQVPGAKMLVDVVQINSATATSQLRKVVQFVCGNTLVCETMKHAQSLAFNGEERLTTVSLDGTMFAKSGVISGGSNNLRSKARCWDEKEMALLMERKNRLTAELRDLMRLKRKESDLKLITAQAQGAQIRLKYSKTDLTVCEISRMESELANLVSQIQMQQESVNAKEAEMKKFRDQIDQIEDLVFSDFCAGIGIVTIREYEHEKLKQQTEIDRKRLEFESQCTRLNAQLDYERDQLEQQQQKIYKLEDTINKEEKTVAEQRQVIIPAQNKLLELKSQLLSKKSDVAAAKAELDQKVQSLREINNEVVKFQREVMITETALEQKRHDKHRLLMACKIQGLPITLLSGSLDDISEVGRQFPCLNYESESMSTTMDIFEREAQLVIDYSELTEELRSLEADEEVEAYLEKLKESVSSIEQVLHHTSAPNLKALEKMREVTDKLQGLTEAFDVSTKLTRKCSQEFEQIKAQRFQLFSQCFEHVSVIIDRIYKRICRNSSAQAILSADNPDEPYLGGISYNCVAPGKRFMSMDNLSGGEKAVAALALLFAIHSYRPAPFFVLDEVDAALDNTNIGKVTSFIREESRKNMQIIVISLKEEFFSKADALQGVYSDVINVSEMFRNIFDLFIERQYSNDTLINCSCSLMSRCSAAFSPWTCDPTHWKRTVGESPMGRTE
uniref:Structural maintenance of chromosomes protein n=1 Tax=Echeneis naucrates TaxID=173247 RepID=A0A665WM57_ECHNA